jgi:hypothetical protein
MKTKHWPFMLWTELLCSALTLPVTRQQRMGTLYTAFTSIAALDQTKYVTDSAVYNGTLKLQ